METTQWYAGRSEAVGRRGVVSAGHPDSTAAGMAVLEAGGNAFDAIVAAAFSCFVCEPANTGIGGYGRLAGFVAGEKRMVSVDHYLRAPAAVREDMFEIDGSKPVKYYETPWTKGQKAERGHLAVGVPGAVPGLFETHRRWGRLPWEAVLEPAIAQADAGLKWDWTQLLYLCEQMDHLADPAMAPLRRHLMPDGRLPHIPGQFGGGDTLDLSELAATLRLIRDKGPAGLHEGEIAALIEKEVKAGGGILTAADMAAYRPKVMVETPRRFAGLDYVACFCPTTYELLNLLGTFDLGAMGPDSADYRHVMAECLGIAFSDTIRWYGDPDTDDAPVQALCDPAFAKRRAGDIAMDRALPRPIAAVDPRTLGIGEAEAPVHLDQAPWPPRLAGTTQVATVDGEGNMAALCTSISGGHGSLVYCPGTGVVLNNGMQNFDPRPGRPNSLKPGKMPIFAAPVIVALKDGRPVWAGSGSGGYRIMTGVVHAFVNWAVHGLGLGPAMEAPKVHCQGRETFVDETLREAVKAELARRGHNVIEQRDHPGLNAFARVNAVSADPASGELRGAAFPGWRGDASAL
jgi:gamma-glutamyltranspeptidase/glutathione hydrolase